MSIMPSTFQSLDEIYDYFVVEHQPTDWKAYEVAVGEYHKTHPPKPGFDGVSYKNLLVLQARLLVDAFSLRWCMWALLRLWGAAFMVVFVLRLIGFL
jgi:hypothetical protein